MLKISGDEKKETRDHINYSIDVLKKEKKEE